MGLYFSGPRPYTRGRSLPPLTLELERYRMAAFRRFTRDDWYGYEGAASLPDGTRPLISQTDTPDGGSVTFLISGPEEETDPGYNLSAHIFRDREKGTGEEWWFREECDVEVARRIGALLPEDADRTTLRALGFRRVD